MKINKNFFSNITYITLSSNHVIVKRQQVELPRHTKNTITCSRYNTLHPANHRPENLFTLRASTKSFSDFHLIWSVGRPRPHVRTSVTSTRSKVKVKVTEFPKLRKVHFSRSISPAVLAWSSKLMVDGHSMGHGLQPIAARFFKFLLRKLTREFKLRPISIFHTLRLIARQP